MLLRCFQGPGVVVRAAAAMGKGMESGLALSKC